MSQRALKPVRLSAMHEAHLALGATFRDEGGWRIPEAYTTPAQETEAARAGVGLGDLSAGGKLQVCGEAAAAVVTGLVGEPSVPPGNAARRRLGGTEVLVGRLAPDELLVLTAPGDAERAMAALAAACDSAGCGHVIDLTPAYAAVDLVGPRATRLLAKLVPVDLEAVPPLGLVQAPLARVASILVRLDRLATPGFRILVAREYGAFVWDALRQAGDDLGLVAIGAAARARVEEGA
jgi:heterotetrameric sarcosine oxidase gamma subunit